MTEEAMGKLYDLKGTLTEQQRFFRSQLTVNWAQAADIAPRPSLSYLEGESRAYTQALLRVDRALRYLNDAIEEAENV